MNARTFFFVALVLAGSTTLVPGLGSAACGKRGVLKEVLSALHAEHGDGSVKPYWSEEQEAHDDSDLLAAAITLRSRGKTQLLSADVLSSLRQMAHVSTDAELLLPTSLKQIFERLRGRMGSANFESGLGSLVGEIRHSLNMEGPYASDPQIDMRDMNRGWGWRLLGDDDPAFKDPTYLAKSVQATGASGHVMELPRTSALDDFHREWRQIAPSNTQAFTFALTGTDANNLLYDIAHKVAGPQAEILSFDGIYAAGGGRLLQHNDITFGGRSSRNRDLRIPSPHSASREPTDPAEIARLEKIEEQALDEIRRKTRSKSPPIGGLLMEPILGAKGVFFFRKSFMLKLRALCDELKIPIFADEILTGGGRTGKFFAYQHYDGFEPDFITFGKGLQVAGIAFVDRQQYYTTYLRPGRMVTLTAHTEPLLKSAQIMKRIRTDGLMQQSEKVGSYFVKKLQDLRLQKLRKRLVYLEAEAKKGYEAFQMSHIEKEIQETRQEILNHEKSEEARNEAIRGIGSLIYVPSDSKPSVRGAMGRLLPPLTLTREQVDQVIDSD